jgi:hypothetical protein
VDQLVSETRWSDALLRGLRWVHDGRDLELALRLGSRESAVPAEVVLLAEWVSELRIHVSFEPNRGGYPMTWDATFARSSQQWRVRLDFGLLGEMSFCCNELKMSEA